MRINHTGNGSTGIMAILIETGNRPTVRHGLRRRNDRTDRLSVVNECRRLLGAGSKAGYCIMELQIRQQQLF